MCGKANHLTLPSSTVWSNIFIIHFSNCSHHVNRKSSACWVVWDNPITSIVICCMTVQILPKTVGEVNGADNTASQCLTSLYAETSLGIIVTLSSRVTFERQLRYDLGKRLPISLFGFINISP